MFKTILIGLVVGFLSCGLLCGGCLYLSKQSGTKHQERFFAAVATGDPVQVEVAAHPLAPRADRRTAVGGLDRNDQPATGSLPKA